MAKRIFGSIILTLSLISVIAFVIVILVRGMDLDVITTTLYILVFVNYTILTIIGFKLLVGGNNG